jgi:hypothetical protein
MSVSGSWQYRPLLRPAQVATAALGLCIVVNLAALVVEIDYRAVLQDLESGIDVAVADVEAGENRSAVAAVAQAVAFLATAIAFIVWFRRAYRNTAGLGATGMRYKPGWSIGAWFVPILALFRPKRIANDIWRASDPELPHRATGWHANKVHGLVHWWWAVWIVANVVSNISTNLYLAAETLSEQLLASSMAIAANVVFVVTAALAILVVRAITIRQEQREEMLATRDRQVPADARMLQPV